MATVIDVGLLAFFLPFFIFLFVFVVMFAILEKTKLFGEGQKTLNLVASFSIAAVSIFTGKLVSLVTVITPWIAFMMIIFLFISAIYIFFGKTQQTFWDVLGETPVFVIVLLIVFTGISVVFETELSPYQSGGTQVEIPKDAITGVPIVAKNPRTEALRTLTHPRVMSALFMLIVSAFAIRFLADKYESVGTGK